MVDKSVTAGEKTRSEDMLLIILPVDIAEEIKQRT